MCGVVTEVTERSVLKADCMLTKHSGLLMDTICSQCTKEKEKLLTACKSKINSRRMVNDISIKVEGKQCDVYL